MNVAREALPWAGLSLVVAAVLVGGLGLVQTNDWDGALRLGASASRVGVVLIPC
jgi:hypothetical protein